MLEIGRWFPEIESFVAICFYRPSGFKSDFLRNFWHSNARQVEPANAHEVNLFFDFSIFMMNFTFFSSLQKALSHRQLSQFLRGLGGAFFVHSFLQSMLFYVFAIVHWIVRVRSSFYAWFEGICRWIECEPQCRSTAQWIFKKEPQLYRLCTEIGMHFGKNIRIAQWHAQVSTV